MTAAWQHNCLHEEETSHDSVRSIGEQNGTLARLRFPLRHRDKASTSETETLFFLPTDPPLQLSITAFHLVITAAVYPSLLLCVISASLRIVQCTSAAKRLLDSVASLITSGSEQLYRHPVENVTQSTRRAGFTGSSVLGCSEELCSGDFLWSVWM